MATTRLSFEQKSGKHSISTGHKKINLDFLTNLEIPLDLLSVACIFYCFSKNTRNSNINFIFSA